MRRLAREEHSADSDVDRLHENISPHLAIHLPILWVATTVREKHLH
jgi:hypothetical protein